MAALIEQADAPVARPLKVLIPLIKEDLSQAKEASERAGMPYYRAAGQKMIEAKPQMPHGEFGSWIKLHFNIGKQHAHRYMKFASATRDNEKSRTRDFSSFSDFMRKEGGDPGYGRVVRKQSWHESVKEQIQRAREEQRKQSDEKQALIKLANRMIDIGYKILAKELHPDRGGSREAMAQLNKIRDNLRHAAHSQL
jgi:hypothetical protein